VHTPTTRDRRASAVLPNPVAAAREAYVRGDFPAVCALLGERRLGPDAPIEARLLRARALIRLQRPADVIDELPAREVAAIVNVDERTTAGMLHGAAVARLENRRGIALLADIAGTAARDRAHPAIRAEVAYYRAIAHWSARELDVAEVFALAAERAGRDVLAVRATQLRGFIAAASERATRYTDALSLFRTAGRRYGRCRERDVALATIIVEQTASLENTLRSATVVGSHRGTRGRLLPGGSFGPAVPSWTRLRICYNDAWLFALDGDDVAAFRMMRDADENAPTPAWQVRARAGRAAIAVVCGEPAGARIFADGAAELASRVDWNATVDEERLAFFDLAEVYSYLGDPEAAAGALISFDAIAAPIENTHNLHVRDRDPRLMGWTLHVRGLLQRGRGDLAGAGTSFAAAVEMFRSCGYLWREALALIELDATPARAAAGEHMDRAAALIREHFPQSFLARRIGSWIRAAVDPLFSTLTPAERDVLRHLLDGRTKREIAALTGRAYDTVRTQVQSIHRKLGTHSEHQILAACARRGVGPSSWFVGANTAVFARRRRPSDAAAAR